MQTEHKQTHFNGDNYWISARANGKFCDFLLIFDAESARAVPNFLFRVGSY